MFDIITFGSASWDIFLELKNKKISKNEQKLIRGKGLFLNFGSKLEIENIHFHSGGGGTNAAATFMRQGFSTSFCGKIGKDLAGREVKKELLEKEINLDFLSETDLAPSNHSVILNCGPKIDRTILVYRGAADAFSKEDIPWDKLQAKWFYLAPFSEKTAGLTLEIIQFARNKGIKIALNPGFFQLSLPKKELETILKNVDVLLLNQEEASLLTKTPYQKEKEIFKKLDKMVQGIAIMTKGDKGAVASDNKFRYETKSLPIKVVDRTGAGDAFGSGFVAGLAQEKNIEDSLAQGIANATFCLTQWGAKEGLLKKGDAIPAVKIEKISI